MHAAPMEDLERLERDVQQLREEFVNLCEVITLTDDVPTVREAARLAIEALKERTEFYPDFGMEWDVGPDREISFEPDEDGRRFEEDDGA